MTSHVREDRKSIFFFFFIYIYIDKSMKRGRVPKGFLSSNTAYMLVYKKLTADWRTNDTKKVKSKKSDAEVNVPSDSVFFEKLTVKEKSDETPEETKQTHNNEDLSLIQEESSKMISKLNSENIIEANESMISKKTDISTTDKSETTKTVVSTNGHGCKDTHDSTMEQLQNKMHCLKQPMVKVVKLDYKRLNGDAHRAMSCGERDFYEEVNFFFIFP